jgi:hypothetical protein
MLPQKNDDINFEYNHVTYTGQGKLNQIVQSKKHSQNHMTQLPYSINIQNTSARVPLKIITDGNQYENNNRFIIILMTMCYSGLSGGSHIYLEGKNSNVLISATVQGAL